MPGEPPPALGHAKVNAVIANRHGSSSGPSGSALDKRVENELLLTCAAWLSGRTHCRRTEHFGERVGSRIQSLQHSQGEAIVSLQRLMHDVALDQGANP